MVKVATKQEDGSSTTYGIIEVHPIFCAPRLGEPHYDVLVTAPHGGQVDATTARERLQKRKVEDNKEDVKSQNQHRTPAPRTPRMLLPLASRTSEI